MNPFHPTHGIRWVDVPEGEVAECAQCGRRDITRLAEWCPAVPRGPIS